MILKAVIQEPSQPAQASVIWLHGLGANGHDFADLSSMLQLPPQFAVRYVFPHAPLRPVTCNGGMVMPAWYDLASLELHAPEDEKGIREGQGWIEALIDREIERGVSASNIFLGGFSQGAAMALHTALRYSKALAGCIVLSGYLPLRHKIKQEAHSANHMLPIVLAHGLLDQVVSYQLGKETQACLLGGGWQPSFMSYSIAHDVSEEEMIDVGRWVLDHF